MQVKPEQASRHLQRLWAVQILYQMEVAGEDSDTAWDKFSDRVPCLEQQKYCQTLVKGVEDELKRLDQALKERVESWDLDRLGLVERNILRLALWELYNGGLPYQVIIDEAVELAKDFSGERAGKFVNGVLAKFVEE